ncbi:MAG: hypothetical protein V3V75_02335 [Thermoguttaceae bacterium]
MRTERTSNPPWPGTAVLRYVLAMAGIPTLLCVFAVGESLAQHPGPAPPYVAPGGAGAVGPTATFEGGIQPSNAWDPYGTAGSGTPTLLAEDPSFQGLPPSIAVPMATVMKFRQAVGLDYHWLVGNGEGEFGINDIDVWATFAIPFLNNPETPLLITPGFDLQLWAGPSGAGAPDMPPNAFGAYLETAWQPQLSQVLSADLAFRIGVYSDFQKVTEQSLRYTGRGLAVFSFSPSFQVKGGIWYLDRVRVKILPAGGIVWTPHPDARFDFLFPNPKITRRLTTVGNTEWWCYVRGEYGGGSWTVKRVSGMLDQADYNDIRFALGLDFANTNGLAGMFEVGVAFEREIRYRSRMPEVYRPKTTFLLGAGLVY